MKEKVEVLLSTMHIKNEKELKEILDTNKITTEVIVINQVDNKENIFNYNDKGKEIKSFQEKGASKSRNRLLENAKGDICIFADDDTKYVDNYNEIIKKGYVDNSNADAIIFWVENENAKREKNKQIGNKKINLIDIMKIRTYEISLRKSAIQKLKEKNIKFDENFGPQGIFDKGEETVFLSEMLKNGFKIYSVNKKIGVAQNNKSTWFKGYNKKYLFDQGAIFYRIYPKLYNLFIIQYIIRKYNLYKENLSILQAYKEMKKGAKKSKEIYGNTSKNR